MKAASNPEGSDPLMPFRARCAWESDIPDRREHLILEHLPQVWLIARRIHERLPKGSSLDDLVSTGILGLIAAIDRFDPSQNVKLKTYAEHRIRGAILDGLRRGDWAPRLLRKRAKQIEAAMVRIEQRLYRYPTEEEIAAELGWSIEEYRQCLVDSDGLRSSSFDSASDDDGFRSVLNHISGDEESWPGRILERAEMRRLLAKAISKLSTLERVILRLYYHEELTLQRISKIVHLHESRISQVKTRAILRLRSHLGSFQTISANQLSSASARQTPVVRRGTQVAPIG